MPKQSTKSANKTKTHMGQMISGFSFSYFDLITIIRCSPRIIERLDAQMTALSALAAVKKRGSTSPSIPAIFSRRETRANYQPERAKEP
jgi:hypothetical protein